MNGKVERGERSAVETRCERSFTDWFLIHLTRSSASFFDELARLSSFCACLYASMSSCTCSERFRRSVESTPIDASASASAAELP